MFAMFAVFIFTSSFLSNLVVVLISAIQNNVCHKSPPRKEIKRYPALCRTAAVLYIVLPIEKTKMCYRLTKLIIAEWLRKFQTDKILSQIQSLLYNTSI